VGFSGTTETEHLAQFAEAAAVGSSALLTATASGRPPFM